MLPYSIKILEDSLIEVPHHVHYHNQQHLIPDTFFLFIKGNDEHEL